MAGGHAERQLAAEPTPRLDGKEAHGAVTVPDGMAMTQSHVMRAADAFVSAPGGRLFVRTWGERDTVSVPIVLLHDSLGSVELWRDLPARLATATRRPVIAYDRLGFGRSDPHPGPQPLSFVDAEAQTGLAAVRAALGIDRMVLFGHSVGGGLAIAAAAQLPDATAAVIAESAQAFVEDRILTRLRAVKPHFEAPAQRQRLARYHGDKAQWILDSWFGTWLAPDFAGWALDAHLRRLRCPVLAMHGDRDEYGSLAHAQRIVDLASAPATMVVVRDCGHIPHREKPERVLHNVKRFLRSHEAS